MMEPTLLFGPDYLSASAVVRRGTGASIEILLVVDERGAWRLPTSRRVSGESLEQTLIRGVRQATGLEVLPVRYLTRYTVSEPLSQRSEEIHYYMAECAMPTSQDPPVTFLPMNEARQRLEASPFRSWEGRILQMV